MCSAPITIDNPYYGLGRDINTKVGTLKLSRSLNWLHDTHSSKIQVPCGSCHQCVSMRQAFCNQRVQMEALRSHLYYFTLTYNNKSLVRTDIQDYKVAYPYYKDVINMFKRLRKAGHKFRYWIVSEYGSSEKHTHRPHYHGILAIEKKDLNDKFEFRRVELFWSKLLLSEWRRNIGCNKYPIWQNLCDYKRVWRNGKINTTYDFHYIEPILNHDNDVSFYVSKYILQYDDRTYKLLMKIKLDPNLSDVETSELLHYIKPRSIFSKDFGDYRCPDVKNYILSCIEKSDKLPQYYDYYTGQSSLLSRYYRKLIPTTWYMDRFMKYSLADDSFLLDDGMTYADYNFKTEQDLRISKHFSQIKEQLKRKLVYC